MSVATISPKTKMMLWGKAAGRCQYEGCNDLLDLDLVTKSAMNASYIAHIYGDQPLGPRYHGEYSVKLAKDLSNLMLLCDRHHRKVDREEVADHPVERLLAMKQKHELRIELLTSLIPEMQSHVLLYGANIGAHGAPLCFKSAAQAMSPLRYPSSSRPVELGLGNSLLEDHTPEYWAAQQDHLVQLFDRYVRPLIGTDKTQHFSIFGLAPMPMLIKLGTLISDISEADVYQRHREPATWQWQEEDEEFEFELIEPENKTNTPVLKLSLSAAISDERVAPLFTDGCSIWELTHPLPHNDFLRSAQHLKKFRVIMRKTFDRIKASHGPQTVVHLFPAMPVSAAIELGRVYMPKADLPLVVYDQQNKHKAFIRTIQLN
ncbi:hypothetical protein ACVW0P_003194 [Mucilaginibacter sp. UYNi724]